MTVIDHRGAFCHRLFRYSRSKFQLVPVDLFLVAVLFRKDTAAILLHVKSQLTCPLVSGTEVGAKITVEKLHAVLPAKPFGSGGDQLVTLVNTRQQGSW